LLIARVAQDGDRPAYVFLGSDLEVVGSLTYAELGRRAQALAARLTALQKPGERVLLAFDNGVDAVCLFWACTLAGVIPVPAPAPQSARPKARKARLSRIASDAGVRIAMTAPELVSAGQAECPELRWLSQPDLLALADSDSAVTEHVPVAPEDIAYLQYTSGSTGSPRGVEITHANVLAQCRALGQAETVDPDRTRGLMWLPWFHDYGLIHGLIQPVYAGAASYLMPTLSFSLNPLKWLEAIGRYGITHSGGPDFAYAACVHALARNKDWSAPLGTWQLATNGAEPVRASTLEAFIQAFAPHGFRAGAFTPSYGLAEAVLGVAMRNAREAPRYLLLDAASLERRTVRAAESGAAGVRTLVSCGAPLPGFEVRIVDPDTGVPCDTDQVGEIWLAGPSVGRGYWGQPEASQARFRAALKGEEGGPVRYLRTGDLGFLSQGELFIAGRHKDLIVVNGRNIHPQDLEETAQAAHPAIRPAGVMAVSVERGDREQVVLMVETQRRSSPQTVRELVDEVKRCIAQEHQLNLHDLVPLPFGALPRTSSGKPQRGAAREMYLQGALDAQRLEAQAPPPLEALDGDDDERLLATLKPIWEEVLGRGSDDPDASFFELGGDSLLATQLVSRVNAALGVALPIRAIFEEPSLRSLLRAARAAPRRSADALARDEVAAPPAPRQPGDRVVLSFSQERMWFMHEMQPNGSAYNIPLAIRLRGPLDRAALERAWAQVLERHEILRTRFVSTPEGPKGEVVALETWPIEVTSVNAVGAGDAEAALHERLAAAASRPFQLDQCPLIRLHLFDVGPNDAVLLVVMHHIVGDQWSCVVFGRELAALYSAAVAQAPMPLPPLPLQYADYAAAHRRRFLQSREDTELPYWSQRLAGLEPLTLAGDFPRPRQPSQQGAALRLPFSREAFAELGALGAAHGASLSMVLLTAVKVLLLRHSGKSDIAIGVPIANRNHLASEPLIGTFVNTLVMRTELQGGLSFAEALGRVRDTALDAHAHQDMPFERLVRELKVRGDPSRSALFSVAFNHINSPGRDIRFANLEWSRLSFDRRAAQFDLSVSFDALYDPCIVLEYATELFSAASIERMGEHLLGILRAAARSPGLAIGSIPILGEAERALLDDWSHGVALPLDHDSLGAQLSAGLRRVPSASALVVGDQHLSHRDLDEASNRLARALRRAGIARGSTVGLFMPRQAELMVALLAVLKAGAAYVPLDPAYPAQRLAYQVADAGMALLLSVQASAEAAGALFNGSVWLLDSERERFRTESPAPLQADARLDARGEDPAYLIYTSGSTGQPKGVAVPHRAVVSLLQSLARWPGMDAQTRLLAVTTLSFDIAVTELLLPLAHGATVVMATEAQTLDGRALAALMEAQDITVLQATPSRWNLLLDSGWPGRPGLRALVTGEPLPRALAEALCSRCGEVWNMYGPTETTVFSSGWRVDMNAPTGISLGRPVANTTLCVLDAQGMRCPVGVMGEIWIGGIGLALGYHGRPELTAERFVELAPGHDSGETRLYRTGDHGRWRWDGSLEHGGRMDDQVKLRGYRIELGEVEARLAGCPGVRQAVVAIRTLPGGGPALVAYVVPLADMPALEDIRRHLLPLLPDHMIPSAVVRIERVPVLANGKTNRQALPMPEPPRTAANSLALPRNHMEQLVWSVWSEALQTTALGVHDNFFDIGGHSLLAVGLARELEKALRRPVPVGLLFTHTSIAELASALATDREAPDLPVAILQPLGEGPPLFLLAGADMYRALAHRLAPDRPVVGLFSQNEIDLLELAPEQPMPGFSIESLASDYLDLIRRLRPHGPYILGGFSIGGVIAYEVARQLREQGEDVALLVLLDCAPPGWGLRQMIRLIWRRLRQLHERGLDYLSHAAAVLRHDLTHREQPGSRRTRAYVQAIKAYRARPYAGKVLLVQSGHDPYARPGYGWDALVPGLSVERVPGRHMSVLDNANATLLAGHLRRHLSSALAHPASPSPSGAASPTTTDQIHGSP
jgi:amino acid adenylation domain-containing protein